MKLSPAATWTRPFALTACVLLGLGTAVALHGALEFHQGFKPFASAVKISVRAGSRPVQPPSAQAAAPRADILPLRTTVASKEKSLAAPAEHAVAHEAPPTPAPAAPAPPIAPTPAELPSGLPTLEQPTFAAQQNGPRVQDLPAMAVNGLPSMPGAEPFVPTFALAAVEKPGGEILVLGMLLNDQGLVEETVIAVPSRYALGDMSMALAYRGKQWLQLDPPMMPGERRWIELRVDHAGKDPARDPLP